MASRFAWGEIELQLQVDKGRIETAAAFSDALATEPSAALPAVLQGIAFDTAAMQKALSKITPEDEQTRQIVADIGSLIQLQMR
jgi:hypothetical protein